ncbi:MAG: hypothetical protein IPI74_07900, partial [Bacteroidales bacterium]|nr:hypothetical protein [Bacteroidales bacterium]
MQLQERKDWQHTFRFSKTSSLIRDFTDIQQNPSFEELQSDKTTEEYYNSFTATIFEKIEEPSAPNKRLELISKEEEKFAFLK